MLALIPARGGSKRLPGKNIRLFCGEPLIAWTIKAALKAQMITDVVVSTDSPEIAKISKKFGARVPFLRPKYLATASAPSRPAFVHTLKKLIWSENKTIDEVCILQPTSPLKTSDDIDHAVKLFKRKKTDSVVSFSKAKHHLSWLHFIADDGKLEKVFSGNSNVSRRRALYYVNGAIYVVTRKLLEQDSVYSKNSYAFVMPAERSIDIDTYEDFIFAESLFLRSLKKQGSR